MPEPTDLNRSVVVIANNESISAAQQSERHLRKIIVPHFKPEYHETSLTTNDCLAVWEKEIDGHHPVIESQAVQLSWVDDKAPQKPHWHQFQIESYSSLSLTELVFRSVDDTTAEFKRIEFTGRVFIPPRVCHYVRLSGPTEVLQFRTEETPKGTDLERDKTICSDCFLSGSCSEALPLTAIDARIGTP